ncbi:MAG TPA: MFS transporter [Chloroflexi bacterium]|nr:MFS transporter [Chloroflexota bacterium]
MLYTWASLLQEWIMATQAETIEQTTIETSEFKTDQVLTIAAGHFVHDTYTSFVAPLLPVIIEKLSLTLTMAGSLTAMMQLPGLLNPFIGYLADKVSLRYFVIFAPAITATLMSSLGLAPSYWGLGFIMILAGISVATFHAPAPAMIGRVAGKRIGTGMSFFMFGGELARTLGPLIAVWAVSIWGLDGMYRLMFLGWGTSLLLFWKLREVPGRTQKAGNLAELTPMLIRFFLPLAVVVFLRLFLEVCLTTYLPTYMTQQGYELKQAAFYLAWLEGAGALGALLGGTISDRLGRRTIMLLAFSTSSLLTFLLLQASGVWLILILILTGFATLSTGPLFLALVQDHLPNNRAVGNGLYLSISFVLRSLIMILVGVGGDRFGLETTFFASAIFSLLALPGVYLLPKVYKFEN